MRDLATLRIALLTHSVNPRGGVVHTLELAAALHALGHEVTVMAPSPRGQAMFRHSPCNIELIDATDSAATPDDRIRTRIDAYARHLAGTRALTARFDVFHAQDGIGANALTTLQENGLIPGFIRTVHHVDRHDSAQINAWEARALRGATRLFCVSGHWQDALLRDYGLDSTLVRNGVDLQRFNTRVTAHDMDTVRRLGLVPEAPLIISLGGIEERKNSVRILQAFLRLRRSFPGAQLAIVGGASLLDHSRYRAQFDEVLRTSGLALGEGGDLVITGVLDDAQIASLLRVARAVAFPSIREGFGLVALEALASGTPTVVSKLAPFTEYLAGTDVHWADPLDVTSIAHALHEALVTPKFPPPALCARFSWSASAKRHAALYREILNVNFSKHH